MPELPEVERARAAIEDGALGRRIVRVDDTDTWVCRPHAPGEIAAALEGATLTAAHRRGKTMWVETDTGPVLGLHLGMAGRIAVDEEPAGNGWDRFSVQFADGGRMALRDKRRLGRVVLDPALDRLGPDAAEVGREAFRAATRRAIRRGGVHTGELIPHRERDGHCPRCGTALRRDTVGGRTTYWCPREQP
jgi:formamidopyrimidine-DNA glycosylase